MLGLRSLECFGKRFLKLPFMVPLLGAISVYPLLLWVSLYLFLLPDLNSEVVYGTK